MGIEKRINIYSLNWKELYELSVSQLAGIYFHVLKQAWENPIDPENSEPEKQFEFEKKIKMIHDIEKVIRDKPLKEKYWFCTCPIINENARKIFKERFLCLEN